MAIVFNQEITDNPNIKSIVLNIDEDEFRQSQKGISPLISSNNRGSEWIEESRLLPQNEFEPGFGGDEVFVEHKQADWEEFEHAEQDLEPNGMS